MSAMLFIDNKYTRTYNSIISNAQNRILPEDTYTEKHHIIPKSLGGSNAKDNLVILTAREHFICHWLLTKMTVGKEKSKMYLALLKMCVSSSTHRRHKITSSRYEQIRIRAGQENSGENSPAFNKKKSPETRKLMSLNNSGCNNPMYGKKQSEDTKRKISEKLRGRTFTEESRKKMSVAQKNKVLGPMSDTHKKKLCGYVWWTNGVCEIKAKNAPDDWKRGRLKKSS